jgi:hypothetical protein
LLLIDRGGLLQQGGRFGSGSTLLLEISEALAKGQLQGQLDKAHEIATLAAAVTVEEIFVSVDIERGPGFRVQRTEPDELGTATGRPAAPMLQPQIVEQRQTLFEFFDILAHGVVFASVGNLEERGQHSQARMVGALKVSQRRRGQRICRTGISPDKSAASASAGSRRASQ